MALLVDLHEFILPPLRGSSAADGELLHSQPFCDVGRILTIQDSGPIILINSRWTLLLNTHSMMKRDRVRSQTTPL